MKTERLAGNQVSAMAWRAPSAGSMVAAFAVACFAVRIVYLFTLSHWNLVADEAHYWEWSRRLDWSYYTKGPGVAWVIGLSTHVFGNSEAAVRLPSAVAGLLMVLAGARIAYDITDRNARAAWYAAILLTLTPAYIAISQLLTTDVFYSAGWLICTWLVCFATRAEAQTTRRICAWATAGLVVGISFLFKYTALLMLPGVLAYLLLVGRRLRWDRATWIGIALAVVFCVIAMGPVIAWNQAHHWPTVAHQLGRVALPGGDEKVEWAWSAWWFVEFVAAQIGLLGVMGAVLIVLALSHMCSMWRLGLRRSGRQSQGELLLICMSAPLLVFYFLLSIFKHSQGNWAIGGYGPLLVLAGIALAERGFMFRPKAERFNAAFAWFVGIGIGAIIVIMLGPRLTQLPGLRDIKGIDRLNQRMVGGEMLAARVNRALVEMQKSQNPLPIVICSSYQNASLLAFYLPGNPVVYCANSQLGSRQTAYDFFADTNLDDPSLDGRTVLLIGASAERWQQALWLGHIEPLVGEENMYVGTGYAGVNRRSGAGYGR